MFGPMSNEPVNLPSWGLRAGYESSSYIDSIFPPLFLIFVWNRTLV